jgi:type I restriction enzyme R subunit
LKKDDPLTILVVCDMLLTGFDAPIEQVMYLDSPLREHTLLQAIARVNRTTDGKTYGLVVDYWGVSEALHRGAGHLRAQSDVTGAMTPKADELPRLQARHANAMNFFAA